MSLALYLSRVRSSDVLGGNLMSGSLELLNPRVNSRSEVFGAWPARGAQSPPAVEQALCPLAWVFDQKRTQSRGKLSALSFGQWPDQLRAPLLWSTAHERKVLVESRGKRRKD